MYHITINQDWIKVEDRPGCFWLFGLFFVAIGGVFVLGVLGLFNNLEEVSIWVRLFTFVMGAIGMGTGLYIIDRSPSSQAIWDSRSQKLTLIRKGLLSKEQTSYPLSDINQFVVDQGADSEGDSIFRPVLKLRKGDLVPLSELWNHNKNEVEELINQLQMASTEHVG